MVTINTREYFRQRKEIFDNLPYGAYLVESGLIQKLGYDGDSNEVGISLYAANDYLYIDRCSHYNSHYRYKALQDTRLIRVDDADLCQQTLLSQISRLEELSLIKGLKLGIEPADPTRLLHFLNWVSEKSNSEDLAFLSQEDIAKYLNSTRVSIARLIKHLSEGGEICKVRGKVRLIQNKKLCR